MNSGYRVERFSGAELPTVVELRRKLESEGYAVYEWTDRPGAVYEVHEHAEDQTHWIISGSLELEVDGFRRVILGPYDRDLMPAGTKHSARVVGAEPVRYLIGERR